MAADPRRPGYHFTAPAGWINDPLGVTWHEDATGGRYELFFQFNPRRAGLGAGLPLGAGDVAGPRPLAGPADRARAGPGRDRLLVGLGGRRRRACR